MFNVKEHSPISKPALPGKKKKKNRKNARKGEEMGKKDRRAAPLVLQEWGDKKEGEGKQTISKKTITLPMSRGTPM